MGAGRNSRQCGHRLTLAAGGDNDDFFVGIQIELVSVDFHLFGNVHVAELPGDVGRDFDAAAVEQDLAVAFGGNVDHLLNPGNVGRKQSDNDPTRAVVGDVGDLCADLPVGNRVALLFHVGGIGQQRQHPLFAAAGKLAHIRVLPVAERVVDFEISRVHDQPQRSVDGNADPVDHAVSDTDELQFEGAELQPLLGMDFVQLAGVQHVVLVELMPHQTEGKGRAEHRSVGYFQQVGQRADVILVGVGQHDSGDQRTVFLYVIQIRDDEIDTQHVVFRKHQPGIDDKQRRAVLEDHHIETNFTEPAQGNDFQLQTFVPLC